MADNKGVDMICLGGNSGHIRENKEMWDNMKDYKKPSSFSNVTMVVFMSVAFIGGFLW